MTLPKAILVASRDTAARRATDLLCYGSTIFPRNEGVLNIATARLLELGVEFAVSARRCFEVDGSKVEIVAQRFLYELKGGVLLETDLWKALNGLIHARSLDVHFASSPDPVFKDDGNVVALHFVFETDRYPPTHVDIFGMAWAFLTFGPFAWDLNR